MSERSERTIEHCFLNSCAPIAGWNDWQGVRA
jgi:hypothetical protein